jgi:hypothetical protein
MKLYNDQWNAMFFSLFIYLPLPYMFRAFFKPVFTRNAYKFDSGSSSWICCKRPGQGGTAEFVHVPSEDGLKEARNM